MSGSVAALRAQLFGVTDYVCGGHGARWPTDGIFTVPAGITILFYVPDGDSLSNTVGQRVDQVLAGGTAPTPNEVVAAGSPCRNYRLFSSKAGGYLNLAMSSSANERYITTTDKDNGIHLEDIVKAVIAKSPNARIHWSACRSLESGTAVFGWDKPDYAGKLGVLATQKSKVI